MIFTAVRSALSAIPKRNINWGDWLAPALILVTPFMNFLNYHHYELLSPDSLSAIAMLIGLGLTGSLSLTLWPQVRLPFLPWPVLLRPMVFAAAVIFLFDFQPDLKKPVIGWISHIFSDGARCAPCIILFFVIVFIPVFAIAYALKRNAGRVFATVFAVMLAATILLPQTDGGRQITVRSDSPATATRRQDLPPIVHIVLDEHIGIEGVPADLPGGAALRSELLDFYVDNGFRVYGKAFSQYHNTPHSLPNLVNGTAQASTQRFVARSGFGYAVTENAWFDRLSALGYRIQVYQTDFVDFCGGKEHRVVKCLTAPATGVAVLGGLEVPVTGKVILLFRYYSEPSSFFGFTNRLGFYLRSFRSNTEERPEAMPDRWRPPALGASWAKLTADRLIDDLGEAESGNAYFAHILLPHTGYILDQNCRLKPDVDSWYDYPRLGMRPDQRLADKSRRARYSEYFKQVRCASRKIGEVLDVLSRTGVLDTATVIVHSDHGSRIAGLPPYEINAAHLTPTDLTDNFSSLFAIRSPGLSAGYDSSLRSVQALFADLVYGQPIEGERAVVFLRPAKGGSSTPLVEHPFSGFD